MTYQSITKTFMDQITGGQLEWEPMNKVYDQVIFVEKDQRPRTYPVISGPGEWERDLKKRFPAEADNISRFFELMKKVHDSHTGSMFVKFVPMWLVKILDFTGLIHIITDFYKWNSKTCKEVIWDMIETQELRDIFCYCFGDFGTPPSKAGFPMQTLLHSHFSNGGAYPVGGASEIAFHIIPVVEAAGGRLLVRAEVSQILVNDGRAYGVQVKKGKEVMNVTAPIIISDAGFFNTMEHLLPTSVAASSHLWPLVKSQAHGPACLSVFVGLNCNAKELNIIHKQNSWVFTRNDIDKLTLEYLNMTREEAMDVDVPLLFISFPSTKDPEWEKRYPGKTTMVIVTLMPYKWVEEWAHARVMKRGDEYEYIKKTFGHKAVEQACQLYPDIKDHIDYVNIGTPVSNRHYLGSPQGEIYGLDHTSDRFSVQNNALLRPATDVPGLYMTGQDVCSCGFTGALYGGLLCASAVLQRNLINDLTALHKHIKRGKKKEE
ncbi:hypothetical protein Pcinc_013175 [Petrolisthes cinctipes]|uniref:Amine oxidase domain-containing protein n=1 Tax=Petrolisthes cinctipes TaxID=88211 RepID=A0AAE1G374_PETCI|nr:hypothetical protein Pcinc_013175 [Petrolisthes cinctipes]